MNQYHEHFKELQSNSYNATSAKLECERKKKKLVRDLHITRNHGSVSFAAIHRCSANKDLRRSMLLRGQEKLRALRDGV